MRRLDSDQLFLNIRCSLYFYVLLVHGPPLLILDEPITGIEDPNDVAVLMNVFREMVNQDRTVIATFHKVYYI